MGRTCGEPDEIELTAIGVKLNGWRTVVYSHMRRRSSERCSRLSAKASFIILRDSELVLARIVGVSEAETRTQCRWMVGKQGFCALRRMRALLREC